MEKELLEALEDLLAALPEDMATREVYRAMKFIEMARGAGGNG